MVKTKITTKIINRITDKKAVKKFISDNSIEVDDKTYFINKLPDELTFKNHVNGNFDMSAFEKNTGLNTLNIYNHKNMKNENSLSHINGFFDGIKQPTENEVRDAMILIIDGNYRIKSGGESRSDYDYSSSLTIDVMNPVNGEDMSVVIVKKYSDKFDDVLITADEITQLYKACMSDQQRQSYRLNQVHGLIGLLFRNEQNIKVNITDSNGNQLTNKSKIKELLLYTLFQKNALQDTIDRLDYIISIELKESTLSIVEDEIGINKTQRHKDRCLKNIEILQKLKQDINDKFNR